MTYLVDMTAGPSRPDEAVVDAFGRTAFAMAVFIGHVGAECTARYGDLTGGLYLEEKADVARYTLALDHLRATALDPSESVAMVKGVIADL